MTIDEFIAIACPKINDLGWAYYFAPETVTRAEVLDLDILMFYGIGRGGVLGDVEAPVVTSAFGYFKPALVEGLWNEARAKISPRDAGRQYMRAAHTYGRNHFSEIEGLEAFCAQAASVVDVAKGRAASLPLFAAFAAEPLAEDLPARSMQLLATLREYRGSVHLLAVASVDLDPKVAHFVARPDLFSMFGWSPDDAPEVGDEEIEKMALAQELTDKLVTPAFAAIDEMDHESFISTLEALEAAVSLQQGG